MRYLFLILAVVFFITPLGVDAQASALSVSFDTNPLFQATNLLPGATADSGFTATNNTADTLDLSISFIEKNPSTVPGSTIADVIDITLTENGGPSTTRTLAQWFVQGQTSIKPALAGGDSAVFVLDAEFNAAAAKQYSNTEVEFDVCVGLSGGDEVCANDAQTTPPDNGGTNGSDNSNHPAGSGGGAGLAGGSATRPPPSIDVTEPAQPGQVAGASITVPERIDNFVNNTLPTWLSALSEGKVAGAATVATATSSSPEATSSAAVSGAPAAPPPPTVVAKAVEVVQNNCVIWWLLLLVVIALSWSVIDDKLRPVVSTQERRFVMVGAFSLLYILGLLAGWYWDFIASTWWLFALLWLLFTAYDYRAHLLVSERWSSRGRNLYFAATSALAIVTSLLWSVPCVWWPFLLIFILSVLAQLADRT